MSSKAEQMKKVSEEMQASLATGRHPSAWAVEKAAELLLLASKDFIVEVVECKRCMSE